MPEGGGEEKSPQRIRFAQKPVYRKSRRACGSPHPEAPRCGTSREPPGSRLPPGSSASPPEPSTRSSRWPAPWRTCMPTSASPGATSWRRYSIAATAKGTCTEVIHGVLWIAAEKTAKAPPHRNPPLPCLYIIKLVIYRTKMSRCSDPAFPQTLFPAGMTSTGHRSDRVPKEIS